MSAWGRPWRIIDPDWARSASSATVCADLQAVAMHAHVQFLSP